MMKIAIIGTGHVGLVMGACFAEQGHDVLCMDHNSDWICALQKGEVPFYEHDLEPLVQQGICNQKLQFTHDIIMSIQRSTYLFIIVGTPEAADGAADLSAIWDVAKAIGQHANGDKCVVIKSTVPVGVSEQVYNIIQKILASRGLDVVIDVVFNPEFLRQGEAIFNFRRPDRIVVGVNHSRAAKQMRELYRSFIDNHVPFLSMDIRSAELSKYAANAMLATRISFMNEMSQLAEKFHADIDTIRQVLSFDERIGPHALFAGCGYGGSCFPKDIKALRKIAQQHHIPVPLLDSVEAVNEAQKKRLFVKIKIYFDQNLVGKRIAIWGLAFKKNTDDIRESPSRVLIEALWAQKAITQVYDPMTLSVFQQAYGQREDLIYCDSAEATLEKADCIAILTDWDEFKFMDLIWLKQHCKNPVIFDGRNIYDPLKMKNLGFHYEGIGRGAAIGDEFLIKSLSQTSAVGA